jgi:hypothetical protein
MIAIKVRIVATYGRKEGMKIGWIEEGILR